MEAIVPYSESIVRTPNPSLRPPNYYFALGHDHFALRDFI